MSTEGRREPPVPPDRSETARRRIAALLSDRFLTAREISSGAGIPEKEVADHLLHLEKTLRREGRRLAVVPAACRSCGFSFRKRDRPARPSRCPVCRGESIEPPAFGIEAARRGRPVTPRESP